MQFSVPQFIEIEDKIIGPLTLKQFLYLGAGAGVLLFGWIFLKLGTLILLAIPTLLFCFALAFIKVNGRPFVAFLGSLIRYISKPRLYLWKKEESKGKKPKLRI